MLAKWASPGIEVVGQVFVNQFVAAVGDGVSPATVETLELVGVDREVVAVEVVVLANQRAGIGTLLGAFSVRWNGWFHGE